MEDETASFSAYFDGHQRPAGESFGSESGKPEAQEVVLPLHDESLHLLTEIARAQGISGSKEHMRSIALQISLDRFTGFCRERGVEAVGELHLSAGQMKDRTLCLFSDTLQELARMERDLHCSETILLETAILQAAGAAGVAQELAAIA